MIKTVNKYQLNVVQKHEKSSVNKLIEHQFHRLAHFRYFTESN